MATPEEIVARYPVVFHMAEAGSWPSIRCHGLLSTSALLDLFEVEEPDRTKIESEWRPDSVRISHPERGGAIIRDQGPMGPDSLTPQLDRMSTSQWYRLLNGKSFFWATRDRLNRFLNARPYRNIVHDVLTVSTSDLLRRHFSRITLADFNTGVTAFGPRHPRGPDAFKTIEDFTLGNGNPGIVEVVVDYHVPDVAEFTLKVERWKGRELQSTVWQRQEQ